MKFISGLFVALFMLFLTCAPAYASSEIVIDSLSDDDLLSLRQRIDEQLLDRGLYPFIELERNDKGDEVIRLQERLSELGFYNGKITGKYDNETQKSIKAFKKANGLENDAIASVEDQRLLFSEKAIPNAPKPTETPRPQKTDDPEHTEYALIDYETYARNPEEYLFRKILLKGQVVQVLGDRKSGFQLRFSVLNTEDIIYVFVLNDPGYNLLEGDRLTIYATLTSSITYETIWGQELTIPACYADLLELTK